MGKIKTVEIVVRGDIVEKNLILKLANRLKESNLRADFSSSVTVPPFLKAVERRYPSLAVLYGTVDIEDLFQFKALVESLCCDEECAIISFEEL
ncbi:MAG: hypothetical protein JSV18_07920 [Candidatus Bathyarchaeota archaeon]|nr:MAG: hypothetical protein JSV18_07920 [Candidatus Bathyarchaeota archaeon]